MTIKKYFIKKSGVEYAIHSFEYTKEGTRKVDVTKISLSRTQDSNFDIGDDVSIGYHDESDVFVAEFNGDITNKEVSHELILTMESYGGRVNRSAFIATVYIDKTLEFIVEDVITNYTNLTYASTTTTGITLGRFVVNEETAGEVIQRILKDLNWQTRVDNSKNFYFESKGAQTSSASLTVGDNAIMDSNWKKNPNKLINSCTVIGGNAKFNTNQTFTATDSQTVFEVTYKIVGNVRVTVEGTEKVGGQTGSIGTFDYSVNREEKKITFESGVTLNETVIIYYEYEVAIKITARNESSISTYGLFPEKITDDTLKTTSDARKLAKKIVVVFGTPVRSGRLVVKWTEDIDVGETVQIVDSFNSIDASFVVIKLVMKYPEGSKKINVGIETIDLSSLNKDLIDRIKKLEAKQDNTDIVQPYLSFPENINVVTKPGRIRTRTRDTSTDSIWGIATWGTDNWDNTYANSYVVTSVTNYNKIMFERFNFTTYKASATTATWDTSGEKVTFTSGQLAQSLSVALNHGTITTATLTSTEVSGSFDYEMTANGGSNWESVTSGTLHTFTNTGNDLRFRVTENAASTGEVSQIKIVYS